MKTTRHSSSINVEGNFGWVFIKNKLLLVTIANLKEFFKEPIVAFTIIILACFLFIFIVYPIFSVLLKSLFLEGTFSIINYIEFFSKKYCYQALINSLILATITTFATTFLSFVFAFVVNRGPKSLRSFFQIIAILPIVAPEFVFGLSLIILGGRQGLIPTFFNFESGFTLFGWFGVILAQVLHLIPLSFIIINNVLSSLNPNLDEAASNLGAGQLKILRTLTIPLCLPGIIKAALLVFVLSMADFGNPALIGGGISFLSVDAYLLVVGQYNLPMSSVYCVMLLIPSLIFFVLHRYVIKENKYVTIGGAPGFKEEKRIHPIIQIPMLIISFVTSLAILTIFITIVGGALTDTIGLNNSLTLKHFSLTRNWFFLKNSLEVSLLAAIIGTTAGTILAYILVRKPIPGKKLLEFVSISGFAVPGTVIGIGFILAFNTPPLKLTGTMAIIVLSMIARTIAVSVEAGIAKLYQIDVSIEEASQSLGGGNLYTFVKVILPLIFTAFFGSLIYNFIHAINTLSAVIFLTSPRFALASIALFQTASEGYVGRACALTLYLILCVFASLSLLYIASKKTISKG